MAAWSDSGTGMGNRGSRLPFLVMFFVAQLVSVQPAPTSLPDCVPAISDTCPAGYYAAPCDPGRAVVSGCRPCPEGTFSDTDSSITDETSCKPWRVCHGPYMTYLWRGKATSDAVCQCTSGSQHNKSSCVPDSVSAGPTEGGHAKQGPADYVGWVIVITITSALIALMCIFWFWTPCLKGEPDYGGGAYSKTSKQDTEKLVNKELTDEEDAKAISFAISRLPGLVPLTPRYTREFLSALMKTASEVPEDTPNDQSAQASSDELQRGMHEWRSDPSHSAKFADIVEAMSVTGYGKKAQQLTKEVYEYIKNSDPTLMLL